MACDPNTTITTESLNDLNSNIKAVEKYADSDDLSFVTTSGKTKDTIEGKNKKADDAILLIKSEGQTAIDYVESEGQTAIDYVESMGQVAIAGVISGGNAAIAAVGGVDHGFYINDPVITESNQYVKFDSGGTIEKYKALDSIPLPYPIDSGAIQNPVNDPNLQLFTTVTEAYVDNAVIRPNMLKNSHLDQPSPTGLMVPIGGDDFNAGDEVWLGVFVSAGGITGLSRDPVTRVINSTTGTVYWDVQKSGPLDSYTGPLVTSWGDNAGLPTEDADTSIADMSTFYRVTLKPNGCVSAKLEQGVVASRHDASKERLDYLRFDTVSDASSVPNTLGVILYEGTDLIIGSEFAEVTSEVTTIQIGTSSLYVKFTETPSIGSFGTSESDIKAAFDYGSNILVKGEYFVDTAITPSIVNSIKGDGVNGSILRGTDTTDTEWILDYENSSGNDKCVVKDIELRGTAEYTGTCKGLRVQNLGLTTTYENIRAIHLNEGLRINQGFGGGLRNYRAFRCQDPLTLNICNGFGVDQYYAQRFQGGAMNVSAQLTGHHRNIIAEFGEDGTNAISFAGSQCNLVDGLYTEGTMGFDVRLSFKNQRNCIGTRLDGMWLNNQKIGQGGHISAAASLGLRIGAFVMQTPNVDFAIETSALAEEMIYVDSAFQLDQNANAGLGDVRGYVSGTSGPLQPIIPLADDNRKVMLCKPTAKYGNGTNSDFQNIAVQTANDARGLKPRLYNMAPRFAVGVESSNFTATGGNTPGNSVGGECASEQYGCVKLFLKGVITSANASQPFFTIKVLNLTTGEEGESSLTSVPSSGSEKEFILHVNVAPGVNNIAVQINREQSTITTNTFTCNRMIMM